MLDVFNPELPSITYLSKTLGDAFINAIMVKWVSSFVGFYSTNGTMDASQIGDTITLIREEYPHYTQEDFKLFFKMAKKGYFGQVYGRMDGEVIMAWLKKYDLHRDTVAQNESIKECDSFNNPVLTEGKRGITHEEYLKLKSRAEKGDKEAQKQLLPP